MMPSPRWMLFGALVLGFALSRSESVVSAPARSPGSPVTILEVAPFDGDGMTHLAIVRCGGNDAGAGDWIAGMLQEKLSEISNLQITRHATLDQASGLRTVDAILDGSLEWSEEAVGLGSLVFQAVGAQGSMRYIRIDRAQEPPRPYQLFDMPLAVSRVLPGVPSRDAVEQTRRAMCAECADAVLAQLTRRPVPVRRGLVRGDTEMYSLLHDSRWADACAIAERRFFSDGRQAPEDYYQYALCAESLGSWRHHELAMDNYRIALHGDPGMTEAAEGLARLEWGALYPEEPLDGLLRVTADSPPLPVGARFGVMGVRGDVTWRHVNTAGEETNLNIPAPMSLPLRLRRTVEWLCNRRSPWRWLSVEIDPTIQSPADFIAATGGVVLDTQGVEYGLFVETDVCGRLTDVQDPGGEPALSLDAAAVATLRVLKLSPRLEVATVVTGEASLAWDSRREGGGGYEIPAVLQARLIQEALASAMRRLQPTLRRESVELPRGDAESLAMIRAGAYRQAEDRLLRQLRADEARPAMGPELRAATLHLLGWTYEARGSLYYEEAHRVYLAALQAFHDIRHAEAAARVEREIRRVPR